MAQSRGMIDNVLHVANMAIRVQAFAVKASIIIPSVILLSLKL